ncbi:serpin family protein [Saccharopolyspora rhizosphaerae]|uniref:Serpin family protein n=1 Tax=Saccharopolyspora rhizosphaerae TaxID=2492662 RepID=A0A426K1S4_9PSEU|nr:serpin family protein [Saccharopolyspora rhizosphaerae]RRO19274.1 serpin family protein [Saccharopolyspora rhizosphaerae]
MNDHLDFTLALHERLAPPPAKTFCWSPYSVSSALGLAATATGGKTREELVNALREEPANLLELLSSASELTAASGEQPVLAVANTLWAHADLPIEESYRLALKDWPGSAVRNAPFQDDPEAARQLINADVAETTRDLIPELLPTGAVHPQTVAALVNALYLKVPWKEAFEESKTAQRPFHAPDGDRDVPTMTAARTLGYAATDGWQVVGLPAAGGVEALVLLPDDELSAAETALDSARLSGLLGAVEQRRVELFLPRFEVSGGAELTDPLGALGVHDLFTPAADFTPLTDRSLRVSEVLHEAVLDVDEAGLEGAAATAVMMRLTAVVREPEPVRVEVDRPFLFLVRHRESGVVYFLARVTDPS